MVMAGIAAAGLAASVGGQIANSGGGGGGSSGGGGGGYGGSQYAPLAGGIVSSLNPPQAQTSAGAYSPPSNIGEGYNYVATGQPSIDALIQQLLGRTSSPFDFQGVAPTNFASTVGGPNAELLRQVTNPAPGSDYLHTLSDVAGPASNQYQNWGGRLQQQGYQLGEQGNTLAQAMLANLPAYQQILEQGTDPRSALYARTQQQLQEQVRAGEAARGISMSPYGAGIENKAMSDFNIDWQSQQLQRALAAMQGYSGAMGNAGNTLTSAGNLVSTGANLGRAGVDLGVRSGTIGPELMALGQQYQQDAINRYLQSQGMASGLDAQNVQQRLQTALAGRSVDLASIAPMLQYLQQAQGGNRLSNAVAHDQAVLVGNQNANASAGLGNSIDSLVRNIPGIAGGLGSLANSAYNSIFGPDKPTDQANGGYQQYYGGSSDVSFPKGTTLADLAAPGSNQVLPM